MQECLSQVEILNCFLLEKQELRAESYELWASCVHCTYQYLFPLQMLVQLWPYINDMVVKILKEQVEPEIQKNVPGFLSSIHFEEISLGEVVSKHTLCTFFNQNSEGYFLQLLVNKSLMPFVSIGPRYQNVSSE